MNRICRWDEMWKTENLDKVGDEFLKRERFWNPDAQKDWKKIIRIMGNYSTGYELEKYIYEHCPEVKPVDPDWEYLCEMDKPGEHTFDCYYNGVSADVKSCYLNGKRKAHIYMYVHKYKTLEEMMHGAELIISKVGGKIAYAQVKKYKIVRVKGYQYYRFPIMGYIGE